MSLGLQLSDRKVIDFVWPDPKRINLIERATTSICLVSAFRIPIWIRAGPGVWIGPDPTCAWQLQSPQLLDPQFIQPIYLFRPMAAAAAAFII